MTDQLTPDERSWIPRACFGAPVVMKLLRIHDEQRKLLERCWDEWCSITDEYDDEATRELAADVLEFLGGPSRDSQPEAPKGQELWISAATHEHLIAAANARIAELEEWGQANYKNHADATLALHAANERADAAELAVEVREQSWRDNEASVLLILKRTETERDQLAQKLDAAERAHQMGINAQVTELESRLETAEDERDQLAARVKWLEARWEESDYCTTAERQVLEASRELLIFERGSTAYVPPEATEDLGRLLHAELANRAAKAKRGGLSE